MNASLELERWLDSATRGLPQESREWVREELRAHYDDALQERLQSGASLAEACRTTLMELGSAGAVSGGLRETHLSEQRYRVAAAASLIFPLTMLAHASLIARGSTGIEALGYDFLLLLPLLYVLRTLNTLLVLRFNLHVERRIQVIALGLVGMTVPEILMDGYWLALTHGISGALSALGLDALNLLMLIDLLGALVMGIGLIWLAETLIRRKALRSFGGVALMTGYALALTSAASVAGRQDWSNLAWMAALTLGIVTHALWTVLFYRAAQPAQAALAA